MSHTGFTEAPTEGSHRTCAADVTLTAPCKKLELVFGRYAPEKVFLHYFSDKYFWCETVWCGVITDTDLRRALENIVDQL